MGLLTYNNLPKYVQTKKAVVDKKNIVPYCFLWSVTAAFSPVENNACVMSYFLNFSEVLKYDNIKVSNQFF